MAMDVTHTTIWSNMPDELLLDIFDNLPAKDLVHALQVCTEWARVATDHFLWKNLFFKDFNVALGTSMPVGAISWQSEYKRLYYEAPVIESEVIEGHTDEVLQVSFSHEGFMFATASKDGTFHVYDCASLPSRLLGSEGTDGSEGHGLEHVMFTAFSPDDRLLLVSGSKFNSNNGYIAIYSLLHLPERLPLLLRVNNRMYDVFGSWFDSRHFLSGNTHDVLQESFCSTAILNKVGTDEHHLDTSVGLFQFVFENFNVMRYLNVTNDPREAHVACSDPGSSNLQASDDQQMHDDDGNDLSSLATGLDPADKLLIFSCGHLIQFGHQLGFKRFSSTKGRYISKKETVGGMEFDKKDKVIELHGQIIGLKIAPEGRSVYVNIRKWLSKENMPADVDLSENIEIVVIDLETLESKGTHYQGHKGLSKYEGCFIIFPDVSNDYVASGSEDCCGVLWDRHYRCLLGRLPHESVVNCVSFCPSDQQVLVSVSDDHHIKVWRSRQRIKQLRSPPVPTAHLSRPMDTK